MRVRRHVKRGALRAGRHSAQPVRRHARKRSSGGGRGRPILVSLVVVVLAGAAAVAVLSRTGQDGTAASTQPTAARTTQPAPTVTTPTVTSPTVTSATSQSSTPQPSGSSPSAAASGSVTPTPSPQQPIAASAATWVFAQVGARGPGTAALTAGPASIRKNTVHSSASRCPVARGDLLVPFVIRLHNTGAHAQTFALKVTALGHRAGRHDAARTGLLGRHGALLWPKLTGRLLHGGRGSTAAERTAAGHRLLPAHPRRSGRSQSSARDGHRAGTRVRARCQDPLRPQRWARSRTPAAPGSAQVADEGRALDSSPAHHALEGGRCASKTFRSRSTTTPWTTPTAARTCHIGGFARSLWNACGPQSPGSARTVFPSQSSRSALDTAAHRAASGVRLPGRRQWRCRVHRSRISVASTRRTPT